MRIKTSSLIALTGLALALTACGTTPKPVAEKPAAPTPAAPTDAPATSDALKKAGIPPVPTGQKRADLLAAIKAAAPDTVKYEDKAIDAARNQCSAINGGAQKLDWSASQRFSYKDVTTTEEQGKAINKALTDSGFCKV
jgi:hypothetical protein